MAKVRPKICGERRGLGRAAPGTTARGRHPNPKPQLPRWPGAPFPGEASGRDCPPRAHGPLGLSPGPAFPLGWAWPPWAPLVVSGPTGSRLSPPQLPSAPHPLGSVCLGPLSAPHKQELPQGPGTRVLHGGWGAEAGWPDFIPGPGLPTSLCTGQSCDHHPPRPLGRACRNGAGTWALSRGVRSVLPSMRRRQGPLLRSPGQPVL